MKGESVEAKSAPMLPAKGASPVITPSYKACLSDSGTEEDSQWGSWSSRARSAPEPSGGGPVKDERVEAESATGRGSSVAVGPDDNRQLAKHVARIGHAKRYRFVPRLVLPLQILGNELHLGSSFTIERCQRGRLAFRHDAGAVHLGAGSALATPPCLKKLAKLGSFL